MITTTLQLFLRFTLLRLFYVRGGPWYILVHTSMLVPLHSIFGHWAVAQSALGQGHSGDWCVVVLDTRGHFRIHTDIPNQQCFETLSWLSTNFCRWKFIKGLSLDLMQAVPLSQHKIHVASGTFRTHMCHYV